MVSGIPPRHSKPGEPPADIDLVAEPVEHGEDSVSPAESDRESFDARPKDEDMSHEPLREDNPQVAAKPRRTGGSSAVAAAILGGMIALAGSGALQYAGLLPSFGQDRSMAEGQQKFAAEIASLNQRIDALPASAPAQPAVASAAVDAQFDALAQKIADLNQRVDRLAAATGGKSGEATAQLGALADQVTGLQAAMFKQAEEEAKARAALETRLAEIEKKANAPRDDVDVGRAIAAAGLKAAIDRGGPFLTELDTLAGVNPDDPAIAELTPFAKTGVPSRADLLAGFPDVANAILDAQNAAGRGQGLWNRLTSSAMSVVKVRPVGNVEGEGADAIVARMENRLQNGDLKAVSLEWNALPEPGKAASNAFKTKLDARIRVEELVSSTINRAVAKPGNQG